MNWLTKCDTLRPTAAVLTVITAAYYLLVVLNNVTDFGANQQFVLHVFAMDTTFRDPDLMWRAITDTTLANAAYIAIIAWETLIATTLVIAAVTWIRALTGKTDISRARQLSTLGWTLVIIQFGGGFITIGGEWFASWQSPKWSGLQAALQNVLIAAIGLILTHLPERTTPR